MMSEIKELFSKIRDSGRTSLTESEARQVLDLAGVKVTREYLATSAQEAVNSAQSIGYPVVLKVVSPDILHKTEAGGVRLGISSAEEVRQTYGEIIAAAGEYMADARIEGVSVQEMVTGGVETLVGVTNRPPFGPTVAFGLGGVFVELMKDITFRLAPLGESVAAEMIDEIKGSALLDGYRGQPACDKEGLARTIARLSDFAVEFSGEIEELDINPLLVSPDGVIALDALITLKEEADKPAAREDPGAKEENDIRAILEPRSIAVIGASTDPTKTGHVLFKNILVNGFPGKVYPINPHADEILGVKAYPNILAVPEDIDMVFFLLPGHFVSALFEDCKKKGVKAACIIAAGFAEVGEEGRKAQEELAVLVKQTGVRCLGPNSIGMINMDQPLLGSFILFENWKDGPISLAGQSGIFAGAVADDIMTRTVQKLGIGKSVIFGNKLDLDETDFTEWAWKDEKTEVIAIHIEGMNDPRRFLSVVNKAKKDKPVIVLKPGRTSAGARASASHTGSLALDDTIVDHAFRQFGVIRAYDLEEFVEFMKAFSYQPVPKGNRVGIVTFSGANGVMSSDELIEHGFEVAEFSDKSRKRMTQFLPEWQPAQNPLDLWASLGVSGNRRTHEEGIMSVLSDENVDAVIVVLLALANAEFDGIREIYQRARDEYPDKPLYSVIIGGDVRERWVNEIEGLDMPVFETTRIAVKCLAAARFYAEQRDQLQPDPVI
jgi:acyl-CoA synthetase (NDP forming)